MVERYIKSACAMIMDSYPELVTTDFEANKELVNEITDIKSKRHRNKVAGRLVTIKKNENRIITSPHKGRQERKKERKR